LQNVILDRLRVLLRDNPVFSLVAGNRQYMEYMEYCHSLKATSLIIFYISHATLLEQDCVEAQ
jgi:hypothetical protein